MIRDLELARDAARDRFADATALVIANAQKVSAMTLTTPGLAYALRATALACERQREASRALIAANEAVLAGYDAQVGRKSC